MKTKNIILSVILSIVTTSFSTLSASTLWSQSTSSTQRSEYVTSQSSDLLVDITHTDRVKSNTTDVYKYTFYARESVYIYVKGDGDTDLDLNVYDENDNLIESDTDLGDECLVSFTPKWRGKFTIKIKNLGSVYNEYTMRIVQ
ncbi:MAG: hypothetical protein K6C30_07195 [Bacteroidaceae bacterium]|nr:hypothetical protein [Bacteroidaceae bacterium]